MADELTPVKTVNSTRILLLTGGVVTTVLGLTLLITSTPEATSTKEVARPHKILKQEDLQNKLGPTPSFYVCQRRLDNILVCRTAPESVPVNKLDCQQSLNGTADMVCIYK
jgi:hypothetical protein